MPARAVVLSVLLLVSPLLAQSDPPARPNIVLIVADDLGYGETGAQGATDIPTPNIDSIAKSGLRFTNGYVSCPYCAPTRAGMMTGRYQQRFGFEFNPLGVGQKGVPIGLPRTETTLAERLKPLGYATGMFGKWHLGSAPTLRPTNRGFDEFYGFLGGMHPYLPGPVTRDGPIYRENDPVDPPAYLTDALADEAVSFVQRHAEGPFFLYLPFNAGHSPLEATEKYLARFPKIADTRRRTFAAMLSAMDDGIGRVLGALRKADLEEETLVIFLSDNGGSVAENTSVNGPLRGHKIEVYEGGIRVPFMIQWKGTLPEGKTLDFPVSSLDIHPTTLAAAGGEAPEGLDGVNLLPFLLGQSEGVPHEVLCWRMGASRAIRMGDWKLVMLPRGDSELYDLSADIGETEDLSEAHPEQVETLRAAFDEWNSQMIEPRWGNAPGQGGRPRRK